MLIAAIAMTLVRPALGVGPFARDFEAYYAAGVTFNTGGDPYSRDVWRVERTIPGVLATRDEVLPFIGPAAFLPFWSLLGRLPFALARDVWLVILGLAAVLIIGCSMRLAGRAISRQTTLAIATFVIVGGPTLSDFALGQVALVSVAALAVALVAARRSATLSIGSTVVAALQPNLTVAFAVAALRSWRAFAYAIIAGLIFVAATLAFGSGAAGFAAYLHGLGEHGSAERFITIQQTVPVVLASLGLPRAAAYVAGLSIALAVLVAITLVALRIAGRGGDPSLLGFTVIPLLVPFFHEHDFVIALVPAIIVLVRGVPMARTLASIACVMIFIDWFGLAQRPSAVLQIACWTIVIGFVVGMIDDDAAGAGWSWRRVIPLATSALCALIAFPLAHMWPAPTWPDTLATTFHVSASVPIAQVWALEQRASGLDRDVFAWGILRGIPLLGCALLTVACAIDAFADHRAIADADGPSVKVAA